MQGNFRERDERLLLQGFVFGGVKRIWITVKVNKGQLTFIINFEHLQHIEIHVLS